MPSASNAAGAIRAGKAFVEFFADDSALVSSIRKTHAVLNGFGRDLVRMGLWMKVTGAGMAAPFLVSAKIFTETGDRLDAMSRRTGLAVESLSGLELATQLTDFSMGAMENALKRMQRTLVQLALGTSQASRALGLLNINASEILNLQPEDQLKLIADRLSEIADPTLRAGAAMAIFGREATGILPMLMGGAAGLEAFKKQAASFGLILDRDVIAAGDKFNDIIEIIRLQINRIQLAIGAGLAPVLIDIATKTTIATKLFIDWLKVNAKLVQSVAKLALTVFLAGSAVLVLGGIFLALAAVVKIILISVLVLGKVFAILAAVVVFVITPFGLLATKALVLAAATGILTTSIKRLGDVFTNLKSSSAKAFQGIWDALLSGKPDLALKIIFLQMRVAFQKGIDDLIKVIPGFGGKWTPKRKQTPGEILSEAMQDVQQAEETLARQKEIVKSVAGLRPFEPFEAVQTKRKEFDKAIGESRRARIEITDAQDKLREADMRVAQFKNRPDKTFDRDIAVQRAKDAWRVLQKVAEANKDRLLTSDTFNSKAALKQAMDEFRDRKDNAIKSGLTSLRDIEGPFDTPESEERLRKAFNRKKQERILVAEQELTTARDKLAKFKKRKDFVETPDNERLRLAAVKESKGALEVAKKNLKESKKGIFITKTALKEAQKAFDDAVGLERGLLLDPFIKQVEIAKKKLADVQKGVGGGSPDSVMDAQAELDAAIEEARKARLQSGGGAPPKLTPEEAKKRSDQLLNLQNKIFDSAGTFTSALLLGRAGGGSAADRTADAVEESVGLLTQIEANTADLESPTFKP